MTAPQSPVPVYHDPVSTNHSRRNSTRKSFASTISRNSSYLESPRTLCPKDGDAFSYDPSHLRAWYLPMELWEGLPDVVKAHLAAVQYAGAAVLTGFERLDKHTQGPGSTAFADELQVQLDECLPLKGRTFSNASSVFQSDLSSPLTVGSSPSESGCTSPDVPPLSLAQTTPSSSFSIGSPEVPEKRTVSRERSFSTPYEPHDAYYATELSHLRVEAIPRLRHACHKVDVEWRELKRIGKVAEGVIPQFEQWWVEKKETTHRLSERSKTLASALGLASTGMGWSAP